MLELQAIIPLNGSILKYLSAEEKTHCCIHMVHENRKGEAESKPQATGHSHGEPASANMHITPHQFLVLPPLSCLRVPARSLVASVGKAIDFSSVVAIDTGLHIRFCRYLALLAWRSY